MGAKMDKKYSKEDLMISLTIFSYYIGYYYLKI
jgi:hypothetical protein